MQDWFFIKVLKQKAKNPNLHGVVSSSDYHDVWYTDLDYFNTKKIVYFSFCLTYWYENIKAFICVYKTNISNLIFKKITHSSGNHGQALAWASTLTDLDCTVVVTKNTPKSKCQAITSYGANIVYCEPTYADRSVYLGLHQYVI